MAVIPSDDLFPVRSYPLKAALVACHDELLPELRRGLVNLSVEVEAEFPSVVAAAAGLPVSAQERRLLVAQVSNADDLAGLERLNETFPGKPILALVDSAGGGRLLQHVMRAGAAQIVGLPLAIDELKSALDRIAVQFGCPVGRTQVIAVSGVAGGCGATTIALNLAEELARLQAGACVLMELATTLGRVATYLDMDPVYTTHELLSDPERLDLQVVRKALTKVADRFYILSGPNKAIVRPRHEPKEILRLVNYARQLAGVLVLDLPSSFDDVYFATLEMAHHVVLVGQQDINSLRGLRLLNETLTNRGAASVPHVVLNRFNPSFIDFRVEAIQRTSGWERISTVANDYKGVSTAANHGMVLRDAAPSSPALADIRTLAHEILGLGRPERSAPARPLHRRLSKLLSMKVVLTA